MKRCSIWSSSCIRQSAPSSPCSRCISCWPSSATRCPCLPSAPGACKPLHLANATRTSHFLLFVVKITDFPCISGAVASCANSRFKSISSAYSPSQHRWIELLLPRSYPVQSCLSFIVVHTSCTPHHINDVLISFLVLTTTLPLHRRLY